jgi:hypothetical protein
LDVIGSPFVLSKTRFEFVADGREEDWASHSNADLIATDVKGDGEPGLGVASVLHAHVKRDGIPGVVEVSISVEGKRLRDGLPPVED